MLAFGGWGIFNAPGEGSGAPVSEPTRGGTLTRKGTGQSAETHARRILVQLGVAAVTIVVVGLWQNVPKVVFKPGFLKGFWESDFEKVVFYLSEMRVFLKK